MAQTIAARVDIAALRAWAQSILDDCNHIVDEVGPSAHRAVLDRMTCHAIIAVIDLANSWPPSTGPEAVPPRIRQALDDYASKGLPTGACLHAVLSNDLRQAFARADVEVAAAMPAILAYISSCLPCASWGSREAVDAWLRRPRS